MRDECGGMKKIINSSPAPGWASPLKSAMSKEARTAEEDIAGIFGRAAATYDGLGRFSHFGDRLVELAGLAPGVTVLDVAAGQGAVTIPAAKRVGPTGRVVGIDISTEMLREAAMDIQHGGWRNVELQQMNADQLQFADVAFDWVLCGFALWMFPHPDRVLRQFFRVLKPGGRLGLTTWSHDSPMQNFNQRILRAHLAQSSDTVNPARSRRFDTKEQLEAALRQAGFSDPRIITEDYESIIAGEELLWGELWSSGPRRYLERMTASALEQVKSDFFRKLQALRRPDGIHAVYRALFTFAAK